MYEVGSIIWTEISSSLVDLQRPTEMCIVEPDATTCQGGVHRPPLDAIELLDHPDHYTTEVEVPGLFGDLPPGRWQVLVTSRGQSARSNVFTILCGAGCREFRPLPVKGAADRAKSATEDFCLTLEPGESFCISRDRVREHLDGDLALQVGVGRPKHLAHAAFADLRRDVVDAEAGAGSEGQLLGSIEGEAAWTG